MSESKVNYNTSSTPNPSYNNSSIPNNYNNYSTPNYNTSSIPNYNTSSIPNYNTSYNKPLDPILQKQPQSFNQLLQTTNSNYNKTHEEYFSGYKVAPLERQPTKTIYSMRDGQIKSTNIDKTQP